MLVLLKKTESKKFRDITQSDNRVDKGFIGKKSAKMMKRSIHSQKRKEKAILDKAKLLKNIEKVDELSLNPLETHKERLIEINNLSISYNNKEIFEKVSFALEKKDSLQLKGINGCGKTSILKLILGENINYSGKVFIMNGLLISYVSQDTSMLKGNLTDFSKNSNIDETLFKTILYKLDFSREQFKKDIEDFSEGQKKKILIAKSLSEKAHIYIWDEPLNHIDILSRIQIEKLIIANSPTIIFVEHDKSFSNNIATKVVNIKKLKTTNI